MPSNLGNEPQKGKGIPPIAEDVKGFQSLMAVCGKKLFTVKGHDVRFQKLCFTLGLNTILLQSRNRWCGRIQWFFCSVALHGWAASWLKETLMPHVTSPFQLLYVFCTHCTHYILPEFYHDKIIPNLICDSTIISRIWRWHCNTLHEVISCFVRTAGQWPLCHVKLYL